MLFLLLPPQAGPNRTASDSQDKSAELSGLRAAVKNLRGELRSAKADVEDLERSSAEDRAARALVEDSLRSEHSAAASLRRELEVLRRHLDMERAAKDCAERGAKESAGKMQLLSQQQQQLATLPGEAEVAAMAALEARLKEEKKQTELLRENKKTISANLKIKTEELRETCQRRDSERERWEEERTRLYEEVDRWRQRSTDAQSAIHTGEAKAKKDAAKIEDKLRKLSKTAVEKTKKQIDEEGKAKEAELKKIADEAEALRQAQEKLKELEKEHGKERKKSMAAISAAESLTGDLKRLQASIDEMSGEKNSRDKMMADAAEREFKLKEDILALREITDAQEAQIDSLRSQVKDKQGRNDDESSNLRAKCDSLLKQMSGLTEELRVATAEKQELDGKLTLQIEEVAKLDARLTRERKSHKQNMEQALNSIVRLCVVAPTVNVQMADQTMAFKAPLPKEKIRAFVQDQVLPKFATIFQQSGDGRAPDGKNLDVWLQNLLVDMQGTIEKHLAKVFAGAK